MTQRVDEFIMAMKADKVLSRRMLKNAWMSGCNTFVTPVSIWHEQMQIEVQLTNSKRFPFKRLDILCSTFRDLIRNYYIWHSDGSCPDALFINLKYIG